MKNLLYVAYHVPPRKGVGTNRSRQLIELLPKLGWNVTVVTPKVANDSDYPTYVQTEIFSVKGSIKNLLGIGSRNTHEALGVPREAFNAKPSLRQRLINLGYSVTSYPDREVGWLPYGVSAVRRLMKHKKFDAILSTSLPVTAHFIAALSRADVPWVADLRDLWSQNHNLVRSSARAWLDGLLERATLGKSAAIVTVSEPMANMLRERFPRLHVFSVPNAFDENEWRDIPFGREETCTLVYAGQFYAGRRDPSLLFEAIALLFQSGRLQPEELRVDIYSDKDEWLQQSIDHYGLSQTVIMRGIVPRSEVLAAERRADALLIALYNHPAEEGVYTGKVFEYLGARRPILAIGGPERSVLDGLLSSTGYGWRCTDVHTLAQRLLYIVETHKRNEAVPLDSNLIREFSSLSMAEKFSDILKSSLK